MSRKSMANPRPKNKPRIRPCPEYQKAPNPTPKPITVSAWVLTNEKGQYRRGDRRSILVYWRRPHGSYFFGGPWWKPRRVEITITPKAK